MSGADGRLPSDIVMREGGLGGWKGRGSAVWRRIGGINMQSFLQLLLKRILLADVSNLVSPVLHSHWSTAKKKMFNFLQ